MTVLPQALRDHLDGDVTSVCFCWIVRRRDGVALGFTDHDRALTVDGVTCEPATGFVAGAVESGLGFAGDMAEVAGALSSDRLKPLLLVSPTPLALAGRAAPAFLQPQAPAGPWLSLRSNHDPK